jgi:hypothetical protein
LAVLLKETKMSEAVSGESAVMEFSFGSVRYEVTKDAFYVKGRCITQLPDETLLLVVGWGLNPSRPVQFRELNADDLKTADIVYKALIK